MFTRKYIIIIGTILIIALIWICLNYPKIEMYIDISKGDFEVTYTIKNGFREKDIKIQIFSDGKFIKTNASRYNEPVTKEIGYYSEADIKRFVKYAVRHNILSMNDNMNAIDLYDGNEVYFEFEIGKRTIRVGGYAPRHVSRSFDKILRKFEELEFNIEE